MTVTKAIFARQKNIPSSAVKYQYLLTKLTNEEKAKKASAKYVDWVDRSLTFKK